MPQIVDQITELSSGARNNVVGMLLGLRNKCRDGARGYSEAARDVREPDLKGVFESFAAQRAKFADALDEMLLEFGVREEEHPSTLGELHRTWIAFRAALEHGNPASILAECERGEQAAISEYEALLRLTLPMNVEELLLDQLSESRNARSAFDRMRRPW